MYLSISISAVIQDRTPGRVLLKRRQYFRRLHCQLNRISIQYTYVALNHKTPTCCARWRSVAVGPVRDRTGICHVDNVTYGQRVGPVGSAK